jgi:hypothetical protein
VYRYPAAPFGNTPDQPVMDEDGAETVYGTFLGRPAVNIGVSIITQTPGARIDPWYLGSLDENTVQGDAGTPVDVNGLTYDYLLPIGAAGASFPRQGQFYVAVDSGRSRFTNQSAAGAYVLRSWVNDVTPPSLQLLTTRVSAGRPTLVVRTLDTQSGVDPYSLTIGYQGVLVAAAAYDPSTGIALFPLPENAPALRVGAASTGMISSDYQEAKNVDTVGPSIMPNTRTGSAMLHVVTGAAVDWLVPRVGVCGPVRQSLVVAASAPGKVSSVRFTIDGKRSARAHEIDPGVWTVTVSLSRGKHSVVATAVGATHTTASRARTVRVCHG